MSKQLCKNCQCELHLGYARKYHGYCSDCDNAGVPELQDKIAALERDAATWRAIVAWLDADLDKPRSLTLHTWDATTGHGASSEPQHLVSVTDGHIDNLVCYDGATREDCLRKIGVLPEREKT